MFNSGLTYAEIQRELENLPAAYLLRIEKRGCRDEVEVHPSLNIRSYRGYYEDVGLGRSHVPVTVGDFRDALQRHLGGTMEGYKGGTYRIEGRTAVWLSEWGDCEDWVVSGFEDADGEVVMLVKLDGESERDEKVMRARASGLAQGFEAIKSAFPVPWVWDGATLRDADGQAILQLDDDVALSSALPAFKAVILRGVELFDATGGDLPEPG